MACSVADSETVFAIECFRPPAIKDRMIQASVKHNLLLAGAGCFQRSARIVQPSIDPLNEMEIVVDVVVFDKDDSTALLGVRS